jgi:lysophospholipase L1-like esterase
VQRDLEYRPAGWDESPAQRPSRPGRAAGLLILAALLAVGGAGLWTVSGASAAPAPVEPTAAPQSGRPPVTTAGRGKPRRTTKATPTRTAAPKQPTATALAGSPTADGDQSTAGPRPPTPSKPLTPVPDRPRIMVLGDSITDGVGSTSRTGYRTALGARLAAAGVRYDFVGSQHSGHGAGDLDHEGHPGWRIDQVADRVDGWLAAAGPDVVLLDIGTNDYVQAYQRGRAPKRLARLIAAILDASPTVRVIVAKLLVCAGAQRAAGITAFNAAIPDLVAGAGPRVTLADMSTISTDDTVDGLHPNDFGYRRMAALWFRALQPVLGLTG